MIDGKAYDLDLDPYVELWTKTTAPYVNPDAPEGKKFTDVRLAAKALLRLHLSGVLKLFADIFGIDDWRALQPKRGEDLLMVLHSYMVLLMRAETQNLTLETESEQSNDSEGSLGDHAGTRLTLTRAGFAGAKALYIRPDTGGALRDVPRPRAIAGPSQPGSGLVSDEDASEVRQRRAI